MSSIVFYFLGFEITQYDYNSMKTKYIYTKSLQWELTTQLFEGYRY